MMLSIRKSLRSLVLFILIVLPMTLPFVLPVVRVVPLGFVRIMMAMRRVTRLLSFPVSRSRRLVRRLVWMVSMSLRLFMVLLFVTIISIRRVKRFLSILRSLLPCGSVCPRSVANRMVRWSRRSPVRYRKLLVRRFRMMVLR